MPGGGYELKCPVDGLYQEDRNHPRASRLNGDSYRGGERMRWSWDGNLARNTPITRTGVRTPPSMWVNDYNKRPSPIELSGMVRSTENGRWFTGRLVQAGDGRQDMNLQRFFGRMNWHSSLAALDRMSWTGRDQSRNMAYCQESVSQITLFKRAGWGLEYSTPQQMFFAGPGDGRVTLLLATGTHLCTAFWSLRMSWEAR